jgi:hypothetical protein
MNPINELNQPALWAIRKLVSDLHGREVTAGSLHAIGYREEAVQLIDLSSVVGALMELIYWILGTSSSMARPRLLHALLQSGRKTAVAEEQIERDLLDVALVKDSLQASLHRAAIFAARLSQKCPNMERRDALVLPSAGVAPLYACIVSLSKIEKSADDLVSFLWDGGPSNVLLFPNLDAVYSYTGEQPLTIQSQHIKPLQAVDYETYQYVVFMQNVRLSSRIEEKQDREREDEDDIGEIDSSRARDLFYGRRRSAQLCLREVLDECINRVVVRSEDKDQFNSHSFDDCTLAIEALQNLFVTQREMDDAFDGHSNQEVIPSSRAAAVFGGRHAPQRDETTLLTFSVSNSAAARLSISTDPRIDKVTFKKTQGVGTGFRRSPSSERGSGELISLPPAARQEKVTKGSREEFFPHVREAAGVRVFISYAREDIQVASKLVNQLERRGIRCWIDARDYRPGGVFDREVTQAIENCSAMVLVLSSKSNENDYIRREVAMADNSGKLILPLRIENVRPQRGLRKHLQHLRWIDAFKSEPDAVGAAVQVLKRNLSRYDLSRN